MAPWGCRVLGGALVACGGLLLVGCSTPGRGVAILSPGESLLADVTPVASPRLTRAQAGEPRPTIAAPPSPISPPASPSLNAIPSPAGIQQANLVNKGEL